MKLKKIGMIAVSAMLIFSTAGCGEKEQEQPKQLESQTAMKQEQPAKEEVSERISKSEEEIFEEFPKLKEIKEYLLENYPTLSRKAQEVADTEEKGKKPIMFFYHIGGGETDKLGVYLSFDESVTKKEMVEAMQYVSKEMDSLFPEGTDIKFWIMARIMFSGDDYKKDYLVKRGMLTLEYKKGENTKYKWQEEIKPNERGTLYIEKIKPDDVVAYFGEETPEQPAVSEPQPAETSVELSIATVRETLSQMGIEETTSLEASDGGFIIGEDKIGFISYMATGVNSEGNVQDIVYTAKKVEGLTAEDFVTNAGLYLMVCAKMPYGETEEGNQAAQFVANSLESALEQEQTIEIKGWNISLMYGKDTNMFALHFSK